MTIKSTEHKVEGATRWIVGNDDSMLRFFVRWISSVIVSVVIACVVIIPVLRDNQIEGCVRASMRAQALAESFENGGQVSLSQKVFHTIPSPGGNGSSESQSDADIRKGCEDAYPLFLGVIG